MAGESEWLAFEKAVEITVSALRGTLTGQGGQSPRFAADVFREVHSVMQETMSQLSERGKTGF